MNILSETNLGTIAKNLHDGLYREECGEEKVEIAEDVNIEQWSLVIFEHQGEGVEDNQEQNKVLIRR